jgi:dienelactone hydrolase
MREQLWILPSGDPATQLRATVFRPDEKKSGFTGPRPMVVINHGTSEATRHAVAMPVYYWLSRWFVDRGYIAVLPQRRGHGATGGELAEAIGTCRDPDHYSSGQVAADDIEAVVKYMTAQSFVAPRSTVVVGVSTGGWASLALAERQLAEVEAIVNFAGGRGGYAFGQPQRICAADRLIAAVGKYGLSARTPTLWLYSSNDSYFGPNLAQAMAAAFNAAGGSAELHILPPYGNDGHALADDQAGWDLWGRLLDDFLTRAHSAPGPD